LVEASSFQKQRYNKGKKSGANAFNNGVPRSDSKSFNDEYERMGWLEGWDDAKKAKNESIREQEETSNAKWVKKKFLAGDFTDKTAIAELVGVGYGVNDAKDLVASWKK
jgi:hypothetical protein